ncbi:MAG: penicillin-binding protein 2 [Patescibacteria group bacterium]
MFFWKRQKPAAGIEPFDDHEDPLNASGKNTEESMTGELGEFWKPQTDIPSEFVGVRVPRGQMRMVQFVVLLTLGTMLARTASLQILNGEAYRARAEGNRTRAQSVRALRGVIFDRNGQLLARNVPTFTLSVTPIDLPRNSREYRNALAAVAALARSTTDELAAKLAEFPKLFSLPIPIVENLDYQEAVSAIVAARELQGVTVEYATRRSYYPFPEASEKDGELQSLAHILGYIGKLSPNEYADLRNAGYLGTDTIGKTGLELSYEKTLRGTYGVRKIEVDARGVERRVIAKNEPDDGSDLTLSLDLEAQRVMEEALRRTGRRKAVGIAMDPRNGEIIALVSLPGYSINAFARGIRTAEYRALEADHNYPLFPRAIAGEYPSGSTVKPVLAAAALAEKLITPATTIFSSGGIRVLSWFFPDWKAGGHGPTNVVKALAESVNTFFYTIGGGTDDHPGLGPARIAEYLRKFGVGEKLGIDLPGEATGFIPTEEWKKKTKNEVWYIGDTYHLAIGQGYIAVTPLQVAAWTAAIGNGGTVPVPHLVRAIKESAGEPRVLPWKQSRTVGIESEYLQTVRSGMRAAVTVGSARYLADMPVGVAGKTGTAEWNDRRPPHAWFTGFAPYQNPEIVVTILVEEGGEGSATAVPVAKEFLRWYFGKRM